VDTERDECSLEDENGLSLPAEMIDSGFRFCGKPLFFETTGDSDRDEHLKARAKRQWDKMREPKPLIHYQMLAYARFHEPAGGG